MQKNLGLDDIERLTKEAEAAEEEGNYQKALDLLEKMLAIEKRELGPEHEEVGGTLSWMGSIYSEQGLYAKAEPLYERALAIHEKVLGAEHPSTAISLNDLAVLYDYQGLYGKAEPK